MEKIAFIGLGNMGLPMAKNLLAAGYRVTGFDVSPAALDELAKAGGEKAPTLGDAVAGAQIVLTMLPSGAQVRQVYCGPENGEENGGEGEEGVLHHAKKNALLIDSSTIDVDTARAVARAAQAKNLPMLDAPVSGGVGGAEGGSLTFMVGGAAASFVRAQPILQKLGKNIFHAGGSGNGQAAKICNNMLLGISMIGTCEAFMLGEKLGLDAQTLFDIASTASGQCWSMTSYCPVEGPVPSSPANHNYQAGFAAAMMLKDLQLSQAAAASTDCQTPMGQRATQLYTALASLGHAGLDFSAIIKMLRGELD